MRKTNLVSIKFLIFIALASGLVTLCARSRDTLYLEGKIIDESSKAGIIWKNIIIQELADSNELLPIELGQFSTDSSGGFKYTLRKIEGINNYNFCLIGNSDYPYTINKLSLGQLEGKEKKIIFSLNRLVDLTIKLNRKSKKPDYDTLRLCWESNGFFGASLYPYRINNYGVKNKSFGLTSDIDLIWIGGTVNSTINTKVFADKKTELIWELYRNGKRKIFRDTITCKRNFANTVYFTY